MFTQIVNIVTRGFEGTFVYNLLQKKTKTLQMSNKYINFLSLRRTLLAPPGMMCHSPSWEKSLLEGDARGTSYPDAYLQNVTLFAE